MDQAVSTLRHHAYRVWRLAVEYAHSCVERDACMAQEAVFEALRESQAWYLGSMSSFLEGVAFSSKREPWLPQLGDPAQIIARGSYAPKHLDFATSVMNGLGRMEPGPAIGVLHDLATRLAVAGCEMLAELLAHFTLSRLPARSIARPAAAAVANPGLPRFEFFGGFCCRRYHVLSGLLPQLLERLAEGPTGPRALRMVEVGVNNALTSQYLLDRFPEVDFDGVDPWIDAEAIYQEASERLARFGSRARLWRQRSEDAVNRFAPGSLDFVFIDGDHSYSAVLMDLRLWRPLVRSGGFLAGHDLFNPAFEGVLDALLQHLAEVRAGGEAATVHFGPDFVWWLEMP